ncbi:hypothetical protein Bca4012_011021 [Brassica carinata]
MESSEAVNLICFCEESRLGYGDNVDERDDVSASFVDIQPPEGVINDDRSSLRRQWPKLFAYGSSGAEQRDVATIEALHRELLHSVFAPVEGDAFPGGAFGRQHLDGSVREVSVGLGFERKFRETMGVWGLMSEYRHCRRREEEEEEVRETEGDFGGGAG